MDKFWYSRELDEILSLRSSTVIGNFAANLNVGVLFGSLLSTLTVWKFPDSRGKVFSERVDNRLFHDDR
jgi:hypothetical protein